MNEEILLTPEEQEDAANWGPCDDWTNICRAQVRKVVEWMEKVGTEFNGVDDPSWRHKALLWSDWKALRAAGEKEVGR